MGSVLIVEDNVALCKLYGRILGHAGVRTTYAHSCGEAFECLRREVPQLALLDMKLPDGSGQEIVNYIRSESHLQSMSIVVISSENHLRSPDVLATVDEFVMKPVSSQHLLELAERFNVVSASA